MLAMFVAAAVRVEGIALAEGIAAAGPPPTASRR